MLSTAWAEKMTAFFRGNAINVLMSQNDVPSHLPVRGGKIRKHGGGYPLKCRQHSGNLYKPVFSYVQVISKSDILDFTGTGTGEKSKNDLSVERKSGQSYPRMTGVVL